MSFGGTTPATAKKGATSTSRIILMLSGYENYIDIQLIEQKQTEIG
jgi:hypothetical protein